MARSWGTSYIYLQGTTQSPSHRYQNPADPITQDPLPKEPISAESSLCYLDDDSTIDSIWTRDSISSWSC